MCPAFLSGSGRCVPAPSKNNLLESIAAATLVSEPCAGSEPVAATHRIAGTVSVADTANSFGFIIRHSFRTTCPIFLILLYHRRLSLTSAGTKFRGIRCRAAGFSRFLSLFPIAQEKRDNIDAHKLLWYLIKELVKLTRGMESGGRTSLRMRDVICLLRSRSGLIHLCGTWLAEVTFVNGMAP